jgi:hypothetical protein
MRESNADTRMLTRLALLISAAVVGSAASVSAQVATIPEPITASPFTIRRPPADLERLTALYNISDWRGLQALGREIICVARRNAPEPIAADDQSDYESCSGGSPVVAVAPLAEATASTSGRPSGSAVADALDLERSHVALMWVAEDAFGKPQLIRVVVNNSDAPAYGVDLPGLSANPGDGRLVELFLSRSGQGRVTSLYTSTREDDPLLATLPAFVKALAGPLFATVGSVAGSVPQGVRGNVGAAPKPKLAATVKRVGLPFRRAAIRLQAIAREPASALAFAASARRLASSVSFNDVPHAACGRRLAATLADELPPVTQTPVCSAATADPLECLNAFDTVLSTNFNEANESCEAGKPSGKEQGALERVDAKFRELVREGASTTAELDLKLKNRPLSRFGFGAGSGVVAQASLTRPRVTTEAGVLVADPLDRVLTMAFVNASLAGYDSEDPHISVAERFRPFFGAALTPDFGPAFGVNVLLVRGIGIAAGGAVLFGKGAERSDIGKEPPAPDDPYKLSVARAVFVGISYNYK